MDSRLYLFEWSGSLARKDSAKFEKKSLKTCDLVFMSYLNDFFFNWDSLHAKLNSHYKAWSYK